MQRPLTAQPALPCWVAMQGVYDGEATTPLRSLYSGALPIVEGVSPCIIGHEASRTLVDGNS